MKKAADKATNYAEHFVHTISHKNDIMEAFFDGYSEAREDMLKDAVEATVMDFSSNQPRPQIDVRLDPHKYHTGDKVRIVVLKAEEE